MVSSLDIKSLIINILKYYTKIEKILGIENWTSSPNLGGEDILNGSLLPFNDTGVAKSLKTADQRL